MSLTNPPQESLGRLANYYQHESDTLRTEAIMARGVKQPELNREILAAQGLASHYARQMARATGMGENIVTDDPPELRPDHFSIQHYRQNALARWAGFSSALQKLPAETAATQGVVL